MVCMSALERITRSRKVTSQVLAVPGAQVRDSHRPPNTRGNAQLSPRAHVSPVWCGGGRPHLFGWGRICALQRVTMREWTLPTKATVSYRTPSWVCRLTSALPSRAVLRQTLRLPALKVGSLVFCLLLVIIWIGLVVVEVDCGLHWETGQHFFPRTLQILLALWNG